MSEKTNKSNKTFKKNKNTNNNANNILNISNISDISPNHLDTSLNLDSSFANMSNNNSNNMNTNISNKNKKKIKAWCGLCFQPFENGPQTKMCKEHLSKIQCNIVKCTKQGSDCIRMFPNVNSENRHTYCIDTTEVKRWRKANEIQQCLGIKRSFENTLIYNQEFDEIINNLCSKNEPNREVNNLIDQIDNLNFFVDEYKANDRNIIEAKKLDFGNANIITEAIKTDNNDKEKENLLEISTFEYSIVNYTNNNDILNNSISKNIEDIDDLFDKIYIDTNIPKNILNKLKAAFKKKGIFNVKMLKLFKDKYKGWDFLNKQFSKICSQIESISVYLEHLYKQ